MNWLDIGLVGAVLIGATAGTALVVRSPTFWLDLGRALFSAMLPFILARKTPEEEARDREAYRRGETRQDGKAHGHGGENR